MSLNHAESHDRQVVLCDDAMANPPELNNSNTSIASNNTAVKKPLPSQVANQ